MTKKNKGLKKISPEGCKVTVIQQKKEKLATELYQVKCDKDGINTSVAENQEELDLKLLKTFGTVRQKTALELLNQAALADPRAVTDENVLQILNQVSSLMYGIGPRDELEAMLATQMVAIHGLSMEMARRATCIEGTVSAVDSAINRITKLSRTFTAQMEALGKYRSGGKQNVRVEHVHVNEGGQAVVGNITQEGGRSKK